MLPGPKVEVLERDMHIHSMAIATNNSLGLDTRNNGMDFETNIEKGDQDSLDDCRV